MNDIFEKIPSAQDVQRWINKDIQDAIESFVVRASKAIERMNERSVNIQANWDWRLLNWIHSEKIKEAFRKKWWEIKYTSDQRDWDYITISMKNYEWSYWSSWHQWDR